MHMRTLSIAAISLSAALAATAAVAQNTQHYTQTNLVADRPGIAAVTDPNLVNPWGLTRSSGSPWWISDNQPGLSTLYTATGAIVPLVVTVPPADNNSPAGSPTGTVFNGSSTDFAVAPGEPALFLWVTEDGTVSGWNPAVNPTKAVIVANDHERSVYRGVTIATVNFSTGAASFLYVADFRQGRIQVFDTNFHHLPDFEGRFQDHRLPEGFAPFNIQNIGGNIYVAYALQDSVKFDQVNGAGLGYVDVYSADGRLLQRLEHGPWFNAPWGMAQASSDFGAFSHDILIGNFGSGQILAFDPLTGRFKGTLQDATNHPLTIDGLWALVFGSGIGSTDGSASTLFFTAGPNNQQNGLFGSIAAVENTQGSDQ
jgi:uncharacterized protein (TIGR03118 family)